MTLSGISNSIQTWLDQGENAVNKMLFVNLPVTDVPKSRAFYEAVGAPNNPQFTDETAACMVFSESIHVMLLTHDK